jgi:hypothetical protein
MENKKYSLAHKISKTTMWILVIFIILVVMFLIYNSYFSRKWFDSRNDMYKCSDKVAKLIKENDLLEDKWFASEYYKQCEDGYPYSRCIVAWVLDKHPELCQEFDSDNIRKYILK